jgi:hypothetical protein
VLDYAHGTWSFDETRATHLQCRSECEDPIPEDVQEFRVARLHELTVIQHAGLGGLSPTKRHGRDPLPVPGEVLELISQLEPF